MPKALVIGVIRFYQIFVSPFLHGFSRVMGMSEPGCRFKITCSQYALECFKFYGFWEASKLTLNRLGRCHPWGGKDPQ